MRKYDRNAIFNIFVKVLLFLAVLSCVFCLMRLVIGIGMITSCAVSITFSAAAVLLFSFLLRYTKFYYAYYSFVSLFLFRKKNGEVFCPCCDKHFSHFEDERFYDDKSCYDPGTFTRFRQDVICDFCRSAPRHRIIAEWAEQNKGLLKDSKILYFAPELSMMLWFRKHNIPVKTADLFDHRADMRIDIMSTGLDNGSFDMIFCNHVLEHVSDHSVALAELHRVLRKGGVLIISFPIDSESDHMRQEPASSADERIRLYGQYDHLRLFGKDSRDMLEKAGFEVNTIDLGNMPEIIVPEEGPSDYDSNMIFVCVRK
ncbi:MAG: methyltransferase domain-containing protein [Clostridiales bacterium]|nr:methyltransferase domain-containing protein [Clostridiales bacterium]